MATDKLAGIKIGLLVGAVGLLFSFLLRDEITGRRLGDSLPLGLAIGQVLRGFLYFNWRSILVHVGFLLGLIGAVTAVFHINIRQQMTRQQLTVEQVQRNAQTAVIINLVGVAIFEVDAFIVGFWYLISGLLSYMFSRFIAEKIAKWWLRQINQ